MTTKQITLALVFLGAATSVNAQSSTRQTDEPLLANHSVSITNTMPTPMTVSALESRELRKHYSNKVTARLTDILNAKFAIQPADLNLK